MESIVHWTVSHCAMWRLCSGWKQAFPQSGVPFFPWLVRMCVVRRFKNVTQMRKPGEKDYLFFFVSDTRLSSGHPANGVHGHPGPDYMYSMNWETCSFMRVRHVPMQGTLLGGQSVATVDSMQQCKLPWLYRARQLQTETRTTYLGTRCTCCTCSLC